MFYTVIRCGYFIKNDYIKCYRETDRTRIIRIEPNADPNKSFFMDVSMAKQQRDEYIHIEKCIYTERDDNGKQLADSITLIANGCDVSAGLIKFKGTFIHRNMSGLTSYFQNEQ